MEARMPAQPPNLHEISMLRVGKLSVVLHFVYLTLCKQIVSVVFTRNGRYISSDVFKKALLFVAPSSDSDAFFLAQIV